ncbi:MAG TPA: hypothetical protein VFH62_02180 [Dehalococcoidia bacterium]|nr:hypothetical protein [Dehalococcoidia bacterium]
MNRLRPWKATPQLLLAVCALLLFSCDSGEDPANTQVPETPNEVDLGKALLSPSDLGDGWVVAQVNPGANEHVVQLCGEFLAEGFLSRAMTSEGAGDIRGPFITQWIGRLASTQEAAASATRLRSKCTSSSRWPRFQEIPAPVLGGRAHLFSATLGEANPDSFLYKEAIYVLQCGSIVMFLQQLTLDERDADTTALQTRVQAAGQKMSAFLDSSDDACLFGLDAASAQLQPFRRIPYSEAPSHHAAQTGDPE